MVRGMALDLKPIRVNLISPGYVDTALWDHMDPSDKQSHFEHAAKQLPTGRIATASDIAESYLYCMKDRNITGSMISTNGGSLII
jgi:NAD(P)-dependent dehydrogenase (short-subunit alcohol dehydrogenase family)